LTPPYKPLWLTNDFPFPFQSS